MLQFVEEQSIMMQTLFWADLCSSTNVGAIICRAVGGNLEVVRPLGEGYKMSRAKRAKKFFSYFSLSYR